MHIIGLKAKVIKIISDYTLQLQLRSGCNKILKTDSVNLTRQLFKAQRKAIRVDPGTTCPLSGACIIQQRQRRTGKSVPRAVWFGNGRVYCEEALQNDLTVPRDSPHWNAVQIYRDRYGETKVADSAPSGPTQAASEPINAPQIAPAPAPPPPPSFQM